MRATTTANRAVARWLLVCCAAIAAMVVIGGVTRLTESGLSIVEWRPVSGVLPPLSDAEWREALEQYRATDQYKLRNAGMSVEEFKRIYWWEYVHRLWGRLIGAVFFVPYVWFLARGGVRGPLAWKLGGLFALGAAQGALGWYMVRSGLVGRIEVSQYRLAAHLGLAFVLYSACLWIALGLLRSGSERRGGGGALAVAALVLATAISGAFVAGLDAGMIYNTFPLMDGRLLPAGYLDLSPAWINPFENPAAVQFNHRVLGLATALTAIAVGLRTRRPLGIWLAAAAATQAALGVATLLLAVPIPVAVFHQAGAVALLTFALMLAYDLRSGSGRIGR